ncbi:hypothetical protein ACWEJ7_30605 [Streptomyces albidoflavus]
MADPRLVVLERGPDQRREAEDAGGQGGGRNRGEAGAECRGRAGQGGEGGQESGTAPPEQGSGGQEERPGLPAG